MKHLRFNRAIVAIAMMLIGWLPSLAHDFEINGVFYNVISTTEVEVTYKGSSHDYYNEYNGSVVIPSLVEYGGFTYSVTSIGDYAFWYCSSLTSIEIPNSVTSIGDWAFYRCTSLISIEIPNSVTSIGDRAFYECTSLTSIQIPNSVTSIGDYAFAGCDSLTSIEIPNSVTSIGNFAFVDCDNLTSIEIPNSVTSIGDWAFVGCSSLTSIEIPNSVTSIGDCAFGDCSSLTSIVVDAGNSIYDSRNDCNAIIETASNTLIAGCKNTIIPNSVTSIGYDAFYWCTSLTSIEIPNSVTSIGDRAFGDCTSLTSVVIGNSVTSIGNEAFWGCESLTSIEIPNSVTSIGKYAFSWCTSLASVVIGNSVTSIGEMAFWGCDSLTKITCLATTPPTIYSNAFSNYDADLYVPAGCKSAYQSANYWKNFNIKEIPTLSTSIALNKTSASLKVTETLTLVATVLPENATNKSVIWKSSNEAVAVVDENGVVTAVGVGEAIITATTTDGSNLSASCKVTVVPTLAETITLDKTEISLEATETATLVASVLPELTTDKSVEWSSSDETVVIVDENGVVSAIALGKAIITATTTDGSDLSASCKVIVVPTLAESITLDKTGISLEATETATLVATVLPELTTNKSVEWSSTDKAVAVVDENGVVTAVAVGEATITATTADGTNLSASCTVTVVPTLAESITLDKTEISLEATETATLVATVLPELTTNKSVAWTSSNEAVATVDSNGVVTAISVGEAIITATTDGSGVTATCNVTVIPTLAVSIELDQAEASVEEKSDLQLIATILPEHTTNKEVAWSSSDKWVASVDNYGLVTMYSAGEVIITATTTDGTNLSATCSINVYSGIDGVNGDDVIVATVGDNIVVKNAKLGSVVNVYASNGALVASEEATDGSVVVEAPVKGIYIVKVGKQTVKVII